MKSSLFIIILTFVFLFSGCVGNNVGPGNPQRRFDRPFNRTMMNITDGNFSRPLTNLTEEQISEMSAVFVNLDSEQLNEYCQEKRMECGYYCRMVNPEHEFCENINNFRNREVFQ